MNFYKVKFGKESCVASPSRKSEQDEQLICGNSPSGRRGSRITSPDVSQHSDLRVSIGFERRASDPEGGDLRSPPWSPSRSEKICYSTVVRDSSANQQLRLNGSYESNSHMLHAQLAQSTIGLDCSSLMESADIDDPDFLFKFREALMEQSRMIEVARSEGESFKKENDSLKYQYDALKLEYEQQVQSFADAEQKIGALTGQIDEAHKAMCQQSQEEENRIKSLTSELLSARLVIENLTGKVEERNREVQRLQEALGDKDYVTNLLKAEVEGEKQKNAQIEDRDKRLLEELEEVQKAMTRVRLEAAEEREAVVKRLSFQIDELKANHSQTSIELQQRQSNAKRQEEDLKVRLVSLEGELEQKSDELQECRMAKKELLDCKEELAIVRNQMAVQKTEADLREKRAIAWHEEKQKLVETLESVTAVKDSLAEKMDTLSRENKEQVGKSQALFRDNREKSGRIEALSREIKEQIGKIEALSRDNREKSGRIEALARETKEQVGKIEALSRETKEQVGKLESISHENKELHQRISNLEADNERFSKSLSKQADETQRIASYSQKVQTLERVHDKQSEAVVKMSVTIEQLNKRLASAIHDNDVLNQHNSSVIHQNEQLILNVTGLQDQLNHMQRQRGEAEAESAKWQQEIRRLTRELNEAAVRDRKSKGLLEENQSLRTDCHKLQKIVKVKENEAIEANEILVSQLKQQKQQLDENVDALINDRVTILRRKYEAKLSKLKRTLQQRENYDARIKEIMQTEIEALHKWNRQMEHWDEAGRKARQTEESLEWKGFLSDQMKQLASRLERRLLRTIDMDRRVHDACSEMPTDTQLF